MPNHFSTAQMNWLEFANSRQLKWTRIKYIIRGDHGSMLFMAKSGREKEFSIKGGGIAYGKSAGISNCTKYCKIRGIIVGYLIFFFAFQ